MNARGMMLVAAMVGALGVSAQPSIVSVKTLPGGAISSARAVSSDGTYVVGDATINGESVPYIWTRQSGMTAIPVPASGSFYTAQNVSHDGRYVTGGYSLDGGLGPSGFVWSQKTGVVPLGSLPGGSERSGVGFFGNQTDFAVGSSSHAFNQNNISISRAVRWTFAGGFEALPLPVPDDIEFTSSASNVLADGRIFIRAHSGSWLWSESTGFEQLVGAEGMRRISSDGSFMAGEANYHPISGFTTPAYWTPDGGVVHLPILEPDDFGLLRDMNSDGSIIVGVLKSKNVMWIDRGLPITIEDYATSIGIDMTGWSILNVWDISDDGSTIVGQARYHGRVEGFVLTIPAPASIGVLGMSLLAARRKR